MREESYDNEGKLKGEKVNYIELTLTGENEDKSEEVGAK